MEGSRLLLESTTKGKRDEWKSVDRFTETTTKNEVGERWWEGVKCLIDTTSKSEANK